MTHNMKLYPHAFYCIADGSKTIELRLNDEKRQKIAVGDTIVFSCTSNDDMIQTQVVALHKFKDFKELYSVLPLDKCGYAENELANAHYTDMQDYYSVEQIKKYGALGIELSGVTAICDVKQNLNQENIYTLLAPSVFNPTPEKLLNRANKYMANESAQVYACLQDGKYIGIVVFEIKDKTATICDIAVNPEHRHSGIGSRLIDFIFSQFDITKIIAETDDDAVEFYKKYGFAVADTKIEFDTKRYTCIFLSA